MGTKRHSDELKQEAVRLIEQEGLPVRTVAQNLDVSEWTVRSWLKKAKTDKGSPIKKLTADEELRQLREENRRLKLEREILKKATAFFASDDR